MWQCDNCGYTDEDGSSFEEETEPGQKDAVRYCPECGSDEVFMVDDEEAGEDDVIPDQKTDENDEMDSWNAQEDHQDKSDP